MAKVKSTDTDTDTDTFVYLSTSWLARKLMVKPSVTLVASGCQRFQRRMKLRMVGERGGERERARDRSVK